MATTGFNEHAEGMEKDRLALWYAASVRRAEAAVRARETDGVENERLALRVAALVRKVNAAVRQTRPRLVK